MDIACETYLTYKLSCDRHNKLSIIMEMGLTKRNSGTYISIFDGKFSQKVDENTAGASSRVNKLGNTVWELFFDSFSGYLKSINIKDGEYGKQWVFGFEANGKRFYWNVNFSNNFATQFLKILPNIDLSQPIKLSPSSKIVDGKPQSSLFVNQGDKVMKHAYTKENPNGLPPLELIKVKGKDTWDDTKRLEFLQNMVETEIMPKLEKQTITPENNEAVATDKKDSLDELVNEMGDDKLDF